MNEVLSPNTRAILLLTAPLIVKRSKREVKLLTHREYHGLAKCLHEAHAEPADLLERGADKLIDKCGWIIDKTRLKALLGRGFELAQAVEDWHRQAIWVVSRADEDYPSMLKKRLKSNAPALLYGCGEKGIAATGGLAIVGSRNADQSSLDYTRKIARQVAEAQCTVVSGAARGVDREAMNAALEAGGKVTGVLTGDLKRTAMNREHRNLLIEKRLLLVSPYDPSIGFNVGHAMQRNKVIYALADAGLVVHATENKGGTWTGAHEQLTKDYSVPYVRSTGKASKGLEALKRMGAKPWPNPTNVDGIKDLLQIQRDQGVAQSEIFSDTLQPTSKDYAEELYSAIRSLVLRICVVPRERQEIVSALNVLKKRPNTWIDQFVEEGDLKKQIMPVRYVALQKEIPETSADALNPTTDTEDYAEELYGAVRSLVLRICAEPRQKQEIVSALNVPTKTADNWIKRLVEEGYLEKQNSHVRYVALQKEIPETSSDTLNPTTDTEDYAKKLYNKVHLLVLRICTDLCAEPRKKPEIVSALNVLKTPNAWIDQFVEKGDLEKQTRPVRYVAPQKELPGIPPEKERGKEHDDT